VNEWSASASEIVAGAFQDHDRGLIVGTRTFGKGLVESLYPLDEGCALQITTAQYFTASGRYIQKPYDIPHRTRKEGSGEQPEYATSQGRTIRGGGGIAPDIEVEEPELSETAQRLEPTFFDFAIWYREQGGDLTVRGPVSAEVLEEYRRFLADREIPLSEEEFTAEREFIEQGIRREFTSVAEGPEAGYRVQLEGSRVIRRAMSVFPELDELLHGEGRRRASED